MRAPSLESGCRGYPLRLAARAITASIPVRISSRTIFHRFMRIHRALSLGFLPGVILVAQAHAAIWLGPLFTDHAVLQRGKPVPIWGRAESGEKIQVRFLDQTLKTTATADGRWAVSLAPMVASDRGADLEVRGTDT